MSLTKWIAALGLIVVAAAAPAAAPVEGPTLMKGPVPLKPLATLMTIADYPRDALNDRVAGQVEFALTVSPEGRAIDCLVEVSSKSSQLDYATCSALKARARFTPALNSQGAPAHGVYRDTVYWFPTPGYQVPKGPRGVDAVISLKQMPLMLADPQYIYIAVIVDEMGRVAECASTSTETNRPERVESRTALKRVACEQAGTTLRLLTARDKQGRPVRSVQPFMLAFSARGSPPPSLPAMAAPPNSPPTVQIIRENGLYPANLYVVVRPDGIKPLYSSDRDEPGKSNCAVGCADTWFPFIAATDARPIGKWTIFARQDGVKQWAFDGRPVYTFLHDGFSGPLGPVGPNAPSGPWHPLPPYPG